MRCGDCDFWDRSDGSASSFPENVGYCARLTAYMEGGQSLSAVDPITPTRSYTGYDGWTATHEDFFCASFEPRVDTNEKA